MTLDATLPAPTARPSARKRQVSDYTELSRRVREAGLMKRRYGHYAARLTILLGLYAACGVAFVAIGESWWQLALAAVTGLVFTQMAYVGHDAAHKQIFTSGKANDWTALIIANLFTGMSVGWWQRKHNRHHAKPNQIDGDPDIGTGALVFIPGEHEGRRGLAGWFTRHQGSLFFPLITLEGLSLHFASIQTVFFSREPVQRRWIEATFLTVRLVGYVWILVAMLPLGMALAFLGVQMAVFGFALGATFAPNHKGMPIVPKDVSIDFLRRQVLMSRNIRGGRFVDTAMGGLNLQIEHHLFPSMPRCTLPQARPIVREYCAEKGIAYTETSLLGSYRIVVRYLNDVGLGARDPFDCPVTAQFRSR